MPTKTEIANKALLRLGQNISIQNVDTDSTVEAGLVRAFYDSSRRETLRQHTWGFARGFRKLVETGNTPVSDRWDFQYKVPNDIIRIVELESRSESDEVPFERAFDPVNQVAVILANLDNAKAITVEDVEDAFFFDDLFADALAFKLAFDIAPSITSDEQRTQFLFQQWRAALSTAKQASNQEFRREEKPEATWIRGR